MERRRKRQRSFQAARSAELSASARAARRWARRLTRATEAVLAACPNVDRDNVRHTLILLQQPPLERLARSLLRGRKSGKGPVGNSRNRGLISNGPSVQAKAIETAAVNITPP